MKATTSFVTGIFLATVGLMSSNTIDNAAGIDLAEEDLLACAWVTYCGDPDIYSPVLKPKDSKSSTQGTKDKKLA